MNAAGVDFSSNRKRRRADRGYVDQITPVTVSGESDAQYSRRALRTDYAEAVRRKSRVKRIVALLLVALVVVGVGVAVGMGVYFGRSDSKLALSDSAASDALVKPAEGEAYYALCAAELGRPLAPSDGTADAYLLMRVDAANRVLSLVDLPANLAVTLSDGETHPLHEALEIGGPAELISAVSAFAGVDISHYAHTDAEGISRMVGLLGGLSLVLEEEVDDPAAGTLYLQAGEQTLDARAVLTLLRASNFSGGVSGQAENRSSVMLAMAASALSSEGLSFASELANMADNVQTSWSSSELMSLADAMRPLDTATVYCALVPGYASGEYYVDSTARWEVMLENLQAGNDPNAQTAASTDFDHAAVAVEVRNGGGVTGAGAKMGELVTACGYQLAEVGNTDDNTVYPETLIIYKDAAYADVADALVSELGAGRVVNGGDFYAFETNLLVIVGKDWMPVS